MDRNLDYHEQRSTASQEEKRYSYQDYFADFTQRKSKDKKEFQDLFVGGPVSKIKQKKGFSSSRMEAIDDNLLLAEQKPSGSITSKFFPMNQMYNMEEDDKYRQKKIVACSFVKRGYGFNHFEQFIEQHKTMYIYVTRQKYKSLTISIIQQGFRKLQWFLRAQCQKIINPLRHNQMRLLVRFLSKQTQYFQRETFDTFNKFISLVYALQSVTVSESQAVQLYKATMEMLKLLMSGSEVKPICYKRKTQPREAIEQSPTIWSDKYEEQLINFYQLNQNFNKIHKCFKTIHPEIEEFTPENLRRKMEGILKEILDQIKHLCRRNKDKLPPLVQLTENRISYIINSNQFSGLRLSILEFRQAYKFQKLQKLTNLVKLINERVSAKSKYDQDEGSIEQTSAKGSKSKASKIKMQNISSRNVSLPGKEDEMFKVNLFYYFYLYFNLVLQ